MVNFDCLNQDYKDRFEFMTCLEGINQEYKSTKYVDVDDICRFLRLIKDKLFSIFDQLTQQDDTVGMKSIIEDVFSIIMTIHNRTKDNVDLLEEFNTIHQILNDYEDHSGLKMKLSILRDVIDQCKIYDSRTVDEVEKAKEKRQEDRITRDDFSFLKD